MKRILSFLLATILITSFCPVCLAAGDDAADAADTLYELGLFQGKGAYPDGTLIYALNDTPTRHEAVTMLVRLLGKEPEAKNGTWDIPFTDVADWARPYVGYAYANGITSGTSETTFGGDSVVTASQYLTFVLRALGYDSSTDFKWDAAWELSDGIGLTDGTYSASNTKFTRGDVAMISCTALQLACKDADSRLIQQLAAENVVDGNTAVSLGLDAYGWLNGMHVHYDIRTFTLYAFMNYTGYDDNNGREIGGVRLQVRNELAAMNLQLSEPDYFTQRNVADEYYEQALRTMGDAPDFRYIPSHGYVHECLQDLPVKLAEFFDAANIPALYEKYRPQYEKAMAGYLTAGKEIIRMIDYFNLAESSLPKEFAIEPNLLDAQGRSIGFGNTDLYHNHGVLRIGPNDITGLAANTHSVAFCYFYVYMHPDVYSMSEQVNSLADRLGVSMDQNRDNFVMECLSHAFTSYFSDEPYHEFSWDHSTAQYLLTSYIYERIPEFENFEGTFKEFISKLLVECAGKGDDNL